MKARKLKTEKVDVKPLGRAIFAIIIFLFLVYIRPWIHPAIMLLYKYPFSGVLIISALLAYLFLKKEKYALGTLFVFLGIISIVILSINTAIIGRNIAVETQYNKIDVLPESSDAWIVPKTVAQRYLEDSMQKSREKVGELNIVNIGDKLVWVAPKIPKGAIAYFTDKVNGIFVVDATKSSRKTNTITKQLNLGEGIGITDNLFWNLLKNRYFVDIEEVYYTYENGSIITIAPVIAYRFKFPVMVPYYDGVFVIDEAGKIEYYSPDRVEQIDYLKKNRAYPKKLARLYAESYKYSNGIMNAWFFHKDQIEITDAPGKYNKQPFLTPTKAGQKWIIAAEPYGESYGIFKIFVVDAISGKIDMLEISEDQTLTGPIIVIDYVKKKFPAIDWSTAKVVEPRPYIINSILNWMLSVTPSDNAGISYTVFVNSWNNEVTSFDTDEGVDNFINKFPIVDQNEKISPENRKSKLIEEIEERLKELKELIK